MQRAGRRGLELASPAPGRALAALHSTTPMPIVTYAHRYKRPPRKRKAVALAAPAAVAKRSRRPVWGEAAARVAVRPRPRAGNEAAQSVVSPAANDRSEVGEHHR